MLGLSRKQLIAAAIFIIITLLLGQAVDTREQSWVIALLVLTIYLFVFEVVSVDVAAITIMVLLGLSSLIGPLFDIAGLVPQTELFKGFSGNAVMSIIAVMIIGAGLDRTGLMGRVASFILKYAGTSEARVIPAIASTVGIISSFMQNVGAAALFLPVVARISSRTGLPMSRLLMPMGFSAILGGTVTMVGSSPLILLNDLILTSNKGLEIQGIEPMATWSLFSVTPIGLALVATGIVYFIIAGRFVLPSAADDSTNINTAQYFRDTYGLEYDLNEIVVPPGSPLVDTLLNDIEQSSRIRVIAYSRGKEVLIGQGAVARDTVIEPNSVLGVMGAPEVLSKFTEDYQLKLRKQLKTFTEALSSAKSGIAEIVIPPSSHLLNKSARDVWLRKRYGVSLVGLHRGGKTMREGEGIRDIPFQSGDTLVVHTTWENLARLQKDRDFVIITADFPHEDLRPLKLKWAGLFFAISLSLVLFSDLRLSISLMVGAIGMILAGVLTIDEAYRAVSWKSVFLLASLIPLGLAVETSGTAAWIAQQVLLALGADTQPWILLAAIGILATFFTLVMSNVGATVLLVPLAVNIAVQVGGNPALYALTVAISTSNSFFLPTHQVNALIMGPAGYRVADFMRAGGIMTLLFLVVSQAMLTLLYG
ncbi:MAG: SLC13 family permease [Gammaproteobacteria bacterium]|nr:SLC13 family permease [Gammaproteobacteria bacterium]